MDAEVYNIPLTKGDYMQLLNTKPTHLKNKSGIYKITCKSNNKSYIGSSVNLYERLQRHLRDLSKQRHCNYYLQRAFDKYGVDNFTYEILEYVDEDTILIREQYYINQYQTSNYSLGYNLCPVAGSRLGTKHRPETIEKYRQFTRIHTEETKQKISESNKGRLLTDEQKEKLSVSLKKYYSQNSNHFLGKSHTDETIQKMREVKLGKTASDETKLKMSANNTGSKNPSSKLTEVEVLEIRLLHSQKEHTVQEIADLFNVAKGTIENIVYRRTWKNI